MARRFFCHSQECILYLRTVTNIDLRCSYVRIVSVLDAHMALAAPEGPNSKRLRSLQTELLQLRAENEDVKLHKSAAARSSNPPFPIHVIGRLNLPVQAQRYDIGDLQLRFSILSEEAAPPTPKQELAGALVLSVLSPSLPAVLRDAMSEELKRKWLSTLPEPVTELCLHRVWEIFREDLVDLISLQPQLLEAYEGVDADGRTVRRFAILNDEVSLHINTSVPGQGSQKRESRSLGKGVEEDIARNETGKVQQGGVGASRNPGESGTRNFSRSKISPRSTRGAELFPEASPAHGQDGGEESGSIQLPHGLAQEVVALRRRYGAAVRTLIPWAVRLQQADEEKRHTSPTKGARGLNITLGSCRGDLPSCVTNLQSLSLSPPAILPPAPHKACTAPTASSLTPPAAPKPPGAGGCQTSVADLYTAQPSSAPPAAETAVVGRGEASSREPFHPEPLLQLDLPLRPTDPSWDPLSTLHILMEIPRSYPAASDSSPAVTLTLTPSPPLPPLALEVLQKLAAGVVQSLGRQGAGETPLGGSLGGGRGLVREVVRYLENHGGGLVQQAEDLAVEVARRRGQGGGSLGGSAVDTLGNPPAGEELRPEQGALAGQGTDCGGVPQPSGHRVQHPPCGVLSGSIPGNSPGSHASWDSQCSNFSGGEEWESATESSGASWEGGEGGEEEAGGRGEAAGGVGHSKGGGSRGGLCLALEGLSLLDCDSLEILKLNLQV